MNLSTWNWSRVEAPEIMGPGASIGVPHWLESTGRGAKTQAAGLWFLLPDIRGIGTGFKAWGRPVKTRSKGWHKAHSAIGVALKDGVSFTPTLS